MPISLCVDSIKNCQYLLSVASETARDYCILTNQKNLHANRENFSKFQMLSKEHFGFDLSKSNNIKFLFAEKCYHYCCPRVLQRSWGHCSGGRVWFLHTRSELPKTTTQGSSILQKVLFLIINCLNFSFNKDILSPEGQNKLISCFFTNKNNKSILYPK